MNISEKLITIAENEQKIYNKGGLDASPQETVSGEAIGITDISPIEHNMGVKISGVDDISTVKLYKQGKNWFNNDTSLIKEVTYISSSTGVESARYGYEIPLPIGTYTIKPYVLDASKQGYIYGCIVNENNVTIQPVTLTTDMAVYTKTITIQKGYLLKIYNGSTAGLTRAQALFSNANIQLEVGTTATEYEPYIEPTIYDVQADGTVEGVKSLYPSTTLYTDTSGAVIDCTYYQDGKKVKENLIEMILSLGGVINE